MSTLNQTELEQILRVYEQRLEMHGFTVEALKSGGLGKQFVRHSIHADLFDLAGRHVVDVGCGLGMFYRFLRNRRNPIAGYTGLDIVEPFLEHNRRFFPEARFLSFDIGDDPVDVLKPDVVFMSQIFNARYADTENEAFAQHVVERFFRAARDGVVVDFMSSYVDFREDEHHYFEPEGMLRFAKRLTPFVDLRHDYLKFEFTLAIRHRPVLATPESADVKIYD